MIDIFDIDAKLIKHFKNYSSSPSAIMLFVYQLVAGNRKNIFFNTPSKSKIGKIYNSSNNFIKFIED